jgi:hypothetical protein
MIFLAVGVLVYLGIALVHSRKYFNNMRTNRITELIDRGIYDSFRPSRYAKCSDPSQYFAEHLATRYAFGALGMSLMWPGFDLWDGSHSLLTLLGRWFNSSAPKTEAEHEFALKKLEADNTRMERELNLTDTPEPDNLEATAYATWPTKIPRTAVLESGECPGCHNWGGACPVHRDEALKDHGQYNFKRHGGFDIFVQQ